MVHTVGLPHVPAPLLNPGQGQQGAGAAGGRGREGSGGARGQGSGAARVQGQQGGGRRVQVVQALGTTT